MKVHLLVVKILSQLNYQTKTNNNQAAMLLQVVSHYKS